MKKELEKEIQQPDSSRLEQQIINAQTNECKVSTNDFKPAKTKQKPKTNIKPNTEELAVEDSQEDFLGLTKKKGVLNKLFSKQKSNNDSIVQNVNISDAGTVIASLKKNQLDAYDEVQQYKLFVKKRKKRLAARITTFAVLLILAPLMIFFGTIVINKNSEHNFFGYRYFIISTISMQPEINVNDCVVLKKVTKQSDLHIGDVIGYYDVNGDVVVHKIQGIIQNSNGEDVYITKGINNTSSDQLPVEFNSIVGKNIATLSIVGNAIIFFRTIPGIILLVVLFACIVVGFYIAFRMSEDIKAFDKDA